MFSVRCGAAHTQEVHSRGGAGREHIQIAICSMHNWVGSSFKGVIFILQAITVLPGSGVSLLEIMINAISKHSSPARQYRNRWRTLKRQLVWNACKCLHTVHVARADLATTLNHGGVSLVHACLCLVHACLSLILEMNRCSEQLNSGLR